LNDPGVPNSPSACKHRRRQHRSAAPDAAGRHQAGRVRGWHLVRELSVDVRVGVHAAGKTVTAIMPCPTGVTRRG
jgi:hypothetical protein